MSVVDLSDILPNSGGRLGVVSMPDVGLVVLDVVSMVENFGWIVHNGQGLGEVGVQAVRVV